MQRYIFVLFVLFIFISNLQAAEMRSWTGSNGKVIEAEFISFDGKVVKLKTPAGKELNVLLSLFSKEDQEFVKNGGKENTENPFGEGDNVQFKSNRRKANADDYKKILSEAEQAIKTIKNPKYQTRAYSNLGVIQAALGFPGKAKESFEKSIQANSDRQERYYVCTAQDAIDVGCFAAAEQCVKELKSLSKNSEKEKAVQIESELASAYAQGGDTKQAEHHLKAALDLFDNIEQTGYSELLNQKIAIAQANLEQFDKAFMTATKTKNVHFWTMIGIAKVYLSKEKYTEAEDTFSIVERDKSYLDFQKATIVKAWIDSGKIDKAYLLLNKINDTAYKANMLREIAVYYLQNDNEKDARNVILEASKMESGNNVFFYYESLIIDTILSSLGEQSDFHNKIFKEINRLTDAQSKDRALRSFALYRKMFGDNSVYRNYVNELNRSGSNVESMRLETLACVQELFGESQEAIKSFEKAKQVADKKDIERLSQSVEESMFNAFPWTETRTTIPYIRFAGLAFSATRIIPKFLVQIGEIDEAFAVIQRIKLQQAKLFALRIMAEEVYHQKKSKPTEK